MPLYTVGNYATTSATPAFITAQVVGIYCVGMRPNTPVNIFFDKKNVNSYVRSATLDTSLSAPTTSDFHSRSPLGGPVGGFMTDSAGDFIGQFFLPAKTFFVGDRELIVADVASVDDIADATTATTVVFKSFNYNADQTDPSFVSTKPSDSQSSVLTNRGSGLSNSRASIFNPMCFAFYVGLDDTEGADGMYLTSIDLYFREKSATKSITFDLRTMENGSPTTTVIPNSKVRLAPGSVNISNTAATATKVTFAAPIYLRAGYEYALSINPDSASPDYSIWTATLGKKDVVSSNTIKRNWGEGTLFTSTNGTTWIPMQDEFPKFKIYRASFSTSANSVTLTNGDHEFLSIANNTLSFTHGEWVYQDTANSTGNIFCNTASVIVTGNNTSFLTTLAAGSKFVITNGTDDDIVTVSSVANNQYLTLKEYPRIIANTTVLGAYKKAVIGQVANYNTKLGELILDGSNASNSSFCFTATSIVIGEITGATASIASVNDKIVNRFLPTIPTSVPQGTSLDFRVTGVDSEYATYAQRNYSLNSANHITDKEVVIASKTNEILYNAGAKSFVANMAMSTTSEYLSPVIDTQDASVFNIRNIINETSYLEHTKNGTAIDKYVSKVVTLREGLDSEDILVTLSGYRPPGTDIEVYAKILNSTDPDAFESKDWSLLENKTPNLYSDIANMDDFKEYEFNFTGSPSSYNKTGVLSTDTTSTTIRGTETQFLNNVVVGDVIKVFQSATSNNFGIMRVSNNYVTANGTISCNNTSTTVNGINTVFNSSNGFVTGAKLYVEGSGQVIGIISSITTANTLTLTTNAFFGATSGANSVSGNTFYTDSFIKVDAAPNFTSSVAVYERVTLTNSAFKNPQNDGIVRYYSASGAAYDSYRSFAIKIVLKSDKSYLVPRVDDMRVIALSV